MVFKIAHRILNLESLDKVPLSWGVEFDVHAFGDRLVVAHEPFIDGILFSDFISQTKGRFLAVNIKEEGIEGTVISELKNKNISNFFLFDVTTPQVFRLGKTYSKVLAIRYSQLEKIDLSESRKFAKYLWLDTFNGEFWLNKSLIREIKNLGFNICFVSPELHRPPIGNKYTFYQNLLKHENMFDEGDSICTKYNINE